jgi:hypothetical protein
MEGPVGIVEHSSEIMSGGGHGREIAEGSLFWAVAQCWLEVRLEVVKQNRGALAHSLGFEQMICMQDELRRIKICFTKQDIYGIVNTGYNIEGI